MLGNAESVTIIVIMEHSVYMSCPAGTDPLF